MSQWLNDSTSFHTNLRKVFICIMTILLFFLIISTKNNSNTNSVITKDMHDVEIIELNLEELEAKINNNETFVFIISKNNCNYCNELITMLKQTNKKTIEDLYYLEYDNSNRDSVISTVEEKLNKITAVPTTFIIKNGQVIDKMTGYIEESKFWDFLNKNLV